MGLILIKEIWKLNVGNGITSCRIRKEYNFPNGKQMFIEHFQLESNFLFDWQNGGEKMFG